MIKTDNKMAHWFLGSGVMYHCQPSQIYFI